MSEEIDLVIVGSIGIDTIQTPNEIKEEILGGSSSYACSAASFFTNTGMVGVIGTDFPETFKNKWKEMGINLDGLQTEEGKTFRWSGIYEENMDNRTTLSTELNVLEKFYPNLPNTYCNAPYLFLGNIHPALQLHVLNQMKEISFVLIDTMDLWINIAKDELSEVIAKCNMLTLNESEAQLFTGKNNLVEAAKTLLTLGPEYILIKKGGNGSMLYSKDSIFLLHAFPVEKLKDPTGAGDSFAGGLMGALAQSKKNSNENIRDAMVIGSIIASFGVEEFSLDRFYKLNQSEINQRVTLFKSMCKI